MLELARRPTVTPAIGIAVLTEGAEAAAMISMAAVRFARAGPCGTMVRIPS
jgi:hypothetical protein